MCCLLLFLVETLGGLVKTVVMPGPVLPFLVADWPLVVGLAVAAGGRLWSGEEFPVPSIGAGP